MTTIWSEIKERLVTGIRHLPYEERRVWVDLIIAINILTGLLVADPSMFFLPPTRGGLRGRPYNGPQYKKPTPEERIDLFGEGVADLWARERERLIISSMTDPHCMMHCTVGGEEQRGGEGREKATKGHCNCHTHTHVPV